MGKYSVHACPEELVELKTPFNLKNDLKGISNDKRDSIAEEIANELIQGLNRPPSSVIVYWAKTHDVAWIKIRIGDSDREAGKSNGYRCILLVDEINKHAFLLHIYRHAHGEDKEISQASKNALKNLVDDYSNSLENMIN